MQSESGPQFEMPAEQLPEVPERPAEQAQETEAEKAHPATHEAGVGKHAPQPGSTATTTDITQLITAPITMPAEPTDQAAKAGPVSPTTADLEAADTDLIEKEWVERAKTIVEKTQDDPHRQKHEMSKVKADYIQKRFKKIIKTDEAPA